MKQQPFQIAIIALVLLIVTVTACRKQFGANNQNDGSMIDDAESFFKDSIVAKEKAMLSKPYSELPRNSNFRLFARMQKISRLLKWDEAAKYTDDGIDYVTVPITGDVKPFHNKSYEAARDLIFYKDEAGQMQMKVIEVLSAKKSSFGNNAQSIMRTSFINSHSVKNRIAINVSADVIFYDADYHKENSYNLTNGVFTKSNFGLYNNASIKSNVANTAMQRNGAGTVKTNSSCGCVTTESYGVTFDINTGQIVSVDYLGSDTKCNDDGAGYGGGTPPPSPNTCAQEAINSSSELMSASTESYTEGFEEFNTPDPFTKQKNPKWTCLKGSGWILSSQEKGIIQYVRYTSDTTEKRWEWKSLEHCCISMTGISVGGGVEPNNGTGTAFVSSLIAGMDLNFDVKYSAAYNCPGLNIIFPPVVLNYGSTCIGWTPAP